MVGHSYGSNTKIIDSVRERNSGLQAVTGKNPLMFWLNARNDQI